MASAKVSVTGAAEGGAGCTVDGMLETTRALACLSCAETDVRQKQSAGNNAIHTSQCCVPFVFTTRDSLQRRHARIGSQSPFSHTEVPVLLGDIKYREINTGLTRVFGTGNRISRARPSLELDARVAFAQLLGTPEQQRGSRANAQHLASIGPVALSCEHANSVG